MRHKAEAARHTMANPHQMPLSDIKEGVVGFLMYHLDPREIYPAESYPKPTEEHYEKLIDEDIDKILSLLFDFFGHGTKREVVPFITGELLSY